MDDKSAAAVLVDSGAHVVRLRRQLLAGSIRRELHQDDAATLERLAFEPVHVAVGDVGSR